MFRMLKLEPPNGWRTVFWELAIVTIGVLIALGAQQWAEERSWARRVLVSKTALSKELAQHYHWSVEWRTVTPCLMAQVDRLQERVLASEATLRPAPTFTDSNFSYVIRLPSKEYTRSVYDAAVADGVAQRFDPDFRDELNLHYAQADFLEAMTRQNGGDYQELFGLSRPVPLDPGVRFELLRTLDRVRGRIEFMDLLSGQLIDHIMKVGMVPSAVDARREVERFGTYRFCTAQGLPLRTSVEAMKAVPN